MDNWCRFHALIAWHDCLLPTAALGDVGSSELALTLAHRVRDFPHTEYRPQELSNVVWALGTLGVLCPPTLDTVLAGVS